LKFFEAIKNLFSRSKAFELYVNNNKRKLIKGLSFLPEKIRQEAELVYFDIFPDTTRFPEKWENVFGIFFTEAELEKRRNILDSLWKINRGGQSAVFLEDMLKKINDGIKIIENIPLKNPREGNVLILSTCNSRSMVCGNKKAVCNYRVGESSFVPMVLQNDVSGLYSIPDNPEFWECCFYVCSQAERDNNNKIVFVKKIKIERKWKNFIEYIILKVKPVHTTAVLYIEWEGELYD